jgi:hypothetical protein
MILPKLGEVYWIDAGIGAKYQPLMIISREDAEETDD